MTKKRIVVSEIHAARMDFIRQHESLYLRSGGASGHIVDLRRDTKVSPHRLTTCLLLETMGRRTGIRRIVALNYGIYRGEVVVVASKGGADVHPSWYLNLRSAGHVVVQIATQAFSGTWREPVGAEREEVWQFMEGIYPPYADYKTATDRQIPLVMITLGEERDPFSAAGTASPGGARPLHR